MTKPRFSLSKAIKAVEISSKIEGHKIQKISCLLLNALRKLLRTNVEILSKTINIRSLRGQGYPEFIG